MGIVNLREQPLTSRVLFCSGLEKSGTRIVSSVFCPHKHLALYKTGSYRFLCGTIKFSAAGAQEELMAHCQGFLPYKIQRPYVCVPLPATLCPDDSCPLFHNRHSSVCILFTLFALFTFIFMQTKI